MSETTTCCYCGVCLLYSDPPYHRYCHENGPLALSRHEAEQRAERAAHDAAMAEAERREAARNRLIDAKQRLLVSAFARADAAEAQIAQAREDGARSMAEWLADTLRLVSEGSVTISADHAFAAWRAAQQTEATG